MGSVIGASQSIMSTSIPVYEIGASDALQSFSYAAR